MTGPEKPPADLLRTMARRADNGQSQSVAAGNGPDSCCGDFDMRIGADGTWFYRNSPIGRLPLVKLFASVLRREPDGSYWLVTPVERGTILVDDVPFVAVEVDADGEGRDRTLRFRTNLDELVAADEAHPIRVEVDSETGEPRPYIHIRDGLEARMLRPVYYRLVELGEFRGDADAEDGEETFGVWSSGRFFTLGRTTPTD
jgi:hypothetical protein